MKASRGRGQHWREVNGRTEEEKLACRCIPNFSGKNLESVCLLLGGRVLVSPEYSTRHTLHNWEREYPLSKLSAFEPYDIIPAPIWRAKIPAGHFNIGITRRQPIITDDAIRVVLPTTGAVYGLTIRSGDDRGDDSDQSIQQETLVKVRFPTDLPWMSAFSHNRAVGFVGKRHDELCFAHYNWAGSEVAHHSGHRIVQSPIRSLGDTTSELLLDQFTNRVLVVGDKATSFYILCASDLPSAISRRRLATDETGIALVSPDGANAKRGEGS
ncbi:hypothetical protein NMY22_g15521 [Coprinellus aureogranulatus]|nr:hypothetical protein NMY22_g15521 [Coprinellus aureogranulatus]